MLTTGRHGMGTLDLPRSFPECVGGRSMRAQEKPARVKRLSPLQ
jgi:hypothetical protein